jgi:hypothetical protein
MFLGGDDLVCDDGLGCSGDERSIVSVLDGDSP